MPDDDLDARYRDLSASQRMLSTGHPHVFYWAAAGEAVLFAALGAVLMAIRTVLGGVLILVLGIVTALFTAWPAHWSEKHPRQARQAVEIQTEKRDRMARRHPAYFVVVVPLLAAFVAATRWNRDRHHPSVLAWVIPAAIGLAFGLTVGAVCIQRARKRQSDGSGRAVDAS